MLELDRVRVTRDGFSLGADMQLRRGQRVAVLGASGAGKSTLLDVVAGFQPVAAGRVLWDEADLTRHPPQDRPVAMLFQDQNLFPHLSVDRNLALALRPDGGRLSAPQQQARAQALARVGLEGLGGRKPGSLSGGQQARAALARVLLQARPVLALDEPFGALGPALKAEMLALVAEVAAELDALVLLVTHAPEDARAFATDVMLVADGQTHPPRATRAFFADPPAAFRRYAGDA